MLNTFDRVLVVHRSFAPAEQERSPRLISPFVRVLETLGQGCGPLTIGFVTLRQAQLDVLNPPTKHILLIGVVADGLILDLVFVSTFELLSAHHKIQGQEVHDYKP